MSKDGYARDVIIIIIMYSLSPLFFVRLEFPRSQWLLLLERCPAGSGDFAEIRRSRDTVDHSRHWRRILSGNGQIGLGTQSSKGPVRLRDRPRR
jgi:hypothetical protein